MKKLIFHIALFCLAHLSFAMTVEFMDDQCSNQSNTGIRLRVDNVGGSATSNVELRYYFHKKAGKTPQLDVYYAPGVSASIKQKDSETAYIEILASSIPSGYFPNQGGMSFGLHYSDWSAWDKSLDPSYQKFSTLQRNDKIAVLVNGMTEQSQAENEEPLMKPILPEDGYTLNAAVDVATGNVYPESKVLDVEFIGGKDDTHLLDVLWRTYDDPVDAKNWDEIYDNPNAGKCPWITTTILNHYYGGNITMDEVQLVSVSDESYPILSPFGHGGLNPPMMLGVLNKVLKTDDIYVWKKSGVDSSEERFSLDMVKEYINRGLLLLLDVRKVNGQGPGHYVVVYGYSKYNIYIANMNNAGKAGMAWYYNDGNTFKFCNDNVFDDVPYNWRCSSDWEYYVDYAFVPNPQKGNVLMSNPLVFYDSDGDGVMNFDETDRFNTNPFSFDTDNDGLGDREDILACVENLYNYVIPKKEGNLSKQKTREYEKNGYFNCANNPDFDEDGIIDGLEDLNGDGFFTYFSESGSNIYVGESRIGEKDERDGLNVFDDIPDKYTIYTFSELKINDRARCYNGIDTLKNVSEKFCNVASWAKADSSILNNHRFENGYVYKFANGFADGNASVSLGVETAIGSLDAWGKVFVRNRAHLYGNLSFWRYPINEKSGKITLDSLRKKRILDYQDGFVVDGQTRIIEEWPPYYARLDDFKIDKQNRTIRIESGKIFDLENGASYAELIVENGATLKIHSGEMFVEKNLQLEPDAKIVFDNLDGSTILHVAGQVLWKTKANTPTTDMIYWSQVASRFKLVSHTSKPIYIEGQWGGTIYNPLGKIVIGQAEKLIYGRFLAKKIELHQYSKLFRVDFVKNPNPPLAVGLK